jgi:hypothetical protein|tara:strand:- start:4886 stop:5389 length:504 start_codon:yes stop_codon:yes gene_type:complete
MIPYEEELRKRRDYVEESIKETWNARTDWYDKYSDFEPFAETSFFGVIWDMSTKILPHLEVQVVIDDNDNCFVSSGSTGFVSFMQQPTGMKLPIKCWIHTHPFGKAYFSGTDWNTVNIWQTKMKEAYVLGGREHFGFWQNTDPHTLFIQESNLGESYYQNQYREEEE